VRRFIARSVAGTPHIVKGTLSARKNYQDGIHTVKIWYWFAFLFFFISPVLFVYSALNIAYFYYKKIYSVYFFDANVEAKYNEILKPATSSKVFSMVGYRVYPEELEDHLRIVSDDRYNKELVKKGLWARRRKERQFGFDLTTLTTHIALIGTTGAGKTMMLLSLFTNVIKAGSGLSMIDGKGDQKIENVLYNLCAAHNYETQFYAIILNNPEKGGDSNTYSPLLSFSSATKTSEFLGELLDKGEGGGGGNHDYFMNRGKVMLANIVMHYKNRQHYYGENFAISDLEISVKIKELNNIYYLSYGILREIEEKIASKVESNVNFRKLIEKASRAKTPQLEEFARTEVLYTYVNQNSHLARNVEIALGMKWDFLSNYFEQFLALSSYIGGISSSWASNVHIVATVIYNVLLSSNNKFLYYDDNPIGPSDIREVYAALKNPESAESDIASHLPENGIITEMELGDFYAAQGIEREDVQGKKRATNETVESIDSQSMQQHMYSDQQWSRLFGLFREYSRILGTPYPDIIGEDILANNKVLYVILPALGASADQIAMLGKMFVLMHKTNAAMALGGERQSATPVQFQIFQNLIKPNPIHLIVLDEVGSFIPPGLSILLSQIRSLRMSMILSAQDVASMKTGGDDREQKRIMANLTKVILRNKDNETKGLEELLPDVEVVEGQSTLMSAVDERLINTGTAEIKKVPSFDVGITTRFYKGFAAFVDGGSSEPILFQSYWVGAESDADKALQIRRMEPISA